jgi:tetratricopeptide (TPR) repeat protein
LERTAGLQTSVTVSYYRGLFAQAHALISEVVATHDELTIRYGRDAFVATISLGFVELHRGQYEVAGTQGEESLTRAQESDNPLVEGACRTLFGAVALAQGAYANAHRYLDQAVAEICHPLVIPAVGWPGYLQVLATLGYAARFMGEGDQAWKHLTEVLRTGNEIQDYLGLLTALPTVALLLIDAGDAERAVELYALASRHGYVANSQWFEDVAGKEIAAVAATLPLDVVAAAQERGRERDLRETAAELLGELESPD